MDYAKLNGRPSKSMVDALRLLYSGESISHLREYTKNVLISRGLVDADLSLTPLGVVKAFEGYSLPRQCASVGISLDVLHTEPQPKVGPELYAYHWYVQQGYVGSHCEAGGFGTAIKALCLDRLTRESVFYGTHIDAREDACLRGVATLSQMSSAQLALVCDDILKTKKSEYLSFFSEINSYSLIRKWHPGLTEEFADHLFDAVPKDHFVRLARWIALDHSHHAGWPDLTLVRNNRLKFVEVKTRDKLHHSQLIAIPALMREIDADVSVLQILSEVSNRRMEADEIISAQLPGAPTP